VADESAALAVATPAVSATESPRDSRSQAASKLQAQDKKPEKK